MFWKSYVPGNLGKTAPCGAFNFERAPELQESVPYSAEQPIGRLFCTIHHFAG